MLVLQKTRNNLSRLYAFQAITTLESNARNSFSKITRKRRAVGDDKQT
jgi:hypothetical protein